MESNVTEISNRTRSDIYPHSNPDDTYCQPCKVDQTMTVML